LMEVAFRSKLFSEPEEMPSTTPLQQTLESTAHEAENGSEAWHPPEVAGASLLLAKKIAERTKEAAIVQRRIEEGKKSVNVSCGANTSRNRKRLNNRISAAGTRAFKQHYVQALSEQLKKLEISNKKFDEEIKSLEAKIKDVQKATDAGREPTSKSNPRPNASTAPENGNVLGVTTSPGDATHTCSHVFELEGEFIHQTAEISEGANDTSLDVDLLLSPDQLSVAAANLNRSSHD